MILAHPAWPLLATAALAPLTRGAARRVLLLAGALASIAVWSRLEPATLWEWGLAGYPLRLLQTDELSLLFGLIFAIITALGILYALHVRSAAEHAATLVYAAGALGVVFAGDWITLFAFWEVMGIASLFVVWQGGTSRSRSAGFRYLLVHFTGGSSLLAGILVHLAAGGSLEIRALTEEPTSPAAFWLILLGVAVNAAVPPLHAWLTDAYPEGSVSGSVFLSAFTTKAAVYVLIRVFPGAEVLAWAGAIMAVYGVFYAVLQNRMRRLLAYHIVSQVGYMVAGAGMGTAMALNGSAAHAFCHILYKALLFMGAGAAIAATGRRHLHELGGIGRRLPLVVLFYMVGALSISGAPLFNGFVSKTMVVAAAGEAHRAAIELLLELASVGTFLSVGLKLPYYAFFHREPAVETRPIPRNMTVSMALTSFLCIFLGVYPDPLYRMLPFAAEYHPYTWEHVSQMLQLLAGTGLAFWLLARKLESAPQISLDTDWLYRKPLARLVARTVEAAASTGVSLHAAGDWLYRKGKTLLLSGLYRLERFATEPGVGGPALPAEALDPDQTRLPIGLTVLWIVLCFALVALYAWRG